MIEGLKVTIMGTELRELCVKHAGFHEARAQYYEKQMEALPEGDEEMPEDLNVSKRPGSLLGERVKKHRQEAQELAFIAAHIDLSETYQLERTDLHRIGIVASAY